MMDEKAAAPIPSNWKLLILMGFCKITDSKMGMPAANILRVSKWILFKPYLILSNIHTIELPSKLTLLTTQILMPVTAINA